MLTKRIIPCLDVNQGRVVKGKKFENLTDVDDPVKLAKYYSAEGADELVFYDITASNDGRNIFLNVVEQTAEEVNIPFTVGGGIRGIQDFHAVLRAGADKVSVNSAAVLKPEIIMEAALKYGRQCVVLSIDAKKNQQGQWTVYINGGRLDTKLDALTWAIKGESLGAGEIVVNSIDTDGIKDGYETELTRAISDAVTIPVVASGGAGKKEDFLKVLTEGRADAALAASVFHYGEIKICDLKDYLASNGLPVRRVE
ncbi:imidazole glycerol phosphate synthase subunit HisF [Geosporobacter ferrireducens]|uniref:Imidazole glycerol phosphate synthase subunit HisF n=2 Tax=Geosporobacter ferrireducens TaxID=1424294 RepID=A0A1D8GP59_9FIRM|nr:imidazole glycerol phosphate synthase subunit HisF [Geosporobacter ferrireducens]AOT72675.1 imidazole glycerol phosphate synthase subunit HisF [Geosporobacter ferrireducens]